MRERVEGLLAGREPAPLTRGGRRRERLPAWEREAEAEWRAFLGRLRAVRVLDPACGSGNFLYVALRLLKDLEREAIQWGAERLRVSGEFPQTGPHNVLGIELNPYARELAGVAIWIGHIQWMIDHGYGHPRDPVLQPLDHIVLRDAVLARGEDGSPVPASWPEAEFVVGNPPFLGMGMRQRASLGDEYVEALREAWRGAVPQGADLCAYWHEMARRQIAAGAAKRAGLLATNSIRDGVGRATLRRIKESGDIFMAWSDEEWTVEGAAVRVSIVAQDDGSEAGRVLDGRPVPARQQQPHCGRRSHDRAASPRKRRRLVPGRQEGRRVRHPRRTRARDAAGADERQRTPQRRRGGSAGERHGFDAPPA